ncbi:MAG: hypothetical protein OXC62_07910 [Aestuariivita sp.]|nr:hypothetical protein [Aestuariivita sp.]
MITQLDVDVAKIINPSHAKAYLNRNNWHKIGVSYNETLEIYESEIDKNAIAYLPISKKYADYITRILQLAKTISDVEDRHLSFILKDLSLAGMDLIRIRAPYQSEDHSILFEEGVAFFQETLKLMTNIAYSKFHPGKEKSSVKNSARMKRWRKEIRLGQTEPGSFIINVLVPMSFSNQGSLIDVKPRSEPHNRLATRQLVSGLYASKEAITLISKGKDVAVFEEKMDKGINADLCESMVKLIETGHGLDISVSWALTIPLPEKQKTSQSTTTFTQSDAGIFKEAVKVLENKQKCSIQPDFSNKRIEGYVYELNRDKSATKGSVKISSVINKKPCAITASFSEKDYSQITRAHDKKLIISVEGNLHKEKQGWNLYNPRNLDVFGDLFE